MLNILEASTIDQFNEKEAQEKKYFDWLAKNPIIDTPLTDTSKKSATTDTAKAKKIKKTNLSMDDGDEEEKSSVRKKVIDRRYYEGKFDNEIPVKLYIRYLKDRANNKTYAYDGLYKFGDQVKYVKLYITRTPDGKWNMEDDPSVGTLELTLKDKTYTGSWTNNDNNTGYDAVLTQADLPQKKLEQLVDTRTTQLNRTTQNLTSETKERKKAEDETIKTKEYLENIIDSASEIIFSFNSSAVIRGVSNACSANSPKVLLGKFTPANNS